MPARVSQHVIADRALAAVKKVLADSGAAADRVASDYGEDLLVQTAHAEKMDASRLWVQVKGTTRIRRHRAHGGYAISVKTGHAARWVRSADLVVVVLWDVERELGYWTLPFQHVNEWDLAEIRSGTIRLPINGEHAFDVEAARRLTWEARIRHAHRVLSVALDTRRSEEELAEDRPAEDDAASKRAVAPLLTISFLELFGILEEDNQGFLQLSRPFWDRLSLATERLLERQAAEGDEDERPEDTVWQAVILSILTTVEDVSGGCGMPHRLLEQCSNTVASSIELGTRGAIQMWERGDRDSQAGG